MHFDHYEILPMTEDEEDLIEEKINAYADSMAPAEPHTEEKQIVFKAEDEEGNIVAGCIVHVYPWGRAVLACLWTDERYRGQGLGSMLIRAAERAAREEGCYYLCLGTVDYMARPLYEKHGFEVFTVNKDVPRGHNGWSMSKRLDRESPDYVPQNNEAETRFTVRSGSREDAGVIRAGLNRYCDLFIPVGHETVSLSKKLVDRDGKIIAAVVADVDGEDIADIGGIWVEEAWRSRGIGSYLLRVAEQEAKENGAYILLSQVCDWSADFFFKNGYTARGTLKDYPKGHLAYEIEKRIER